MSTLPPLTPPQLPSLALSDTALLQARVGALEARIQALEAILTQTADGLAIASRGNISITASKDLFIRCERNMSTTVGADSATAVGSNVSVDVGKERLERVGDHYRLESGPARIDSKKSGAVEISGGQIAVKGTGDVAIRGSKVTQN